MIRLLVQILTPRVPALLAALAILAAIGAWGVRPVDGDTWPVWLEFIGSAHPLILHLPIGLWCGVVGLMIAGLWLPSRELPSIITGLAVFTALTAVAAFGTGLTLYAAGGYARSTLAFHLYGALAFLVGTVVFVWLRIRSRDVQGHWAALLGTSLLLGFAGHQGGVITHGNPLEKAPWVVFESRSTEQRTALAEAGAPRAEPVVFRDLIHPILEEKCMKCHGAERAKGRLRMDSLPALIAGGSKGTSLVPGNPETSLVLQRIRLPLEDREHMPPEDRTQVTAEELALLDWWIAAGTPDDLAIADANLPEQHTALVTALTGDSPEALRRRRDLAEKTALLSGLAAVQQAYPGVLVQSVEGEIGFELHSASLFDADEAGLRSLLQPLAARIRRIEWTHRTLEDAWVDLFMQAEQLEVLHLRHCRLTTPQLDTLLGAVHPLATVNLSGTPLAPDAAATLLPLIDAGTIRTLVLADTGLDSTHLSQLQSAMPSYSVIY